MTVTKLFRQTIFQQYGKRMLNTNAAVATARPSHVFNTNSNQFSTPYQKSFGFRKCQDGMKRTLFYVTDTTPNNDVEQVLRSIDFVEMKAKQGSQLNFFVPDMYVPTMVNFLRSLGY